MSGLDRLSQVAERLLDHDPHFVGMALGVFAGAVCVVATLPDPLTSTQLAAAAGLPVLTGIVGTIMGVVLAPEGMALAGRLQARREQREATQPRTVAGPKSP